MNKINKEIKSPLRYPGGKSRAIPFLMPLVPSDMKELREPFVGGGSVFLTSIQRFPHVKHVINDLNYDLYCFWKSLRDDSENMIRMISDIWNKHYDGRKLFDWLCSGDHLQKNELERGVRFFILNRITFSGTVESGGFSLQSFNSRFTESSIARVAKTAPLMRNVDVLYGDYESLITKDGEDVFIFLDPPYYSAMKSRLYGKNGDLHTMFDHDKFAQVMKSCKHKWMITYDDSEKIRDLFDFAYINEFTLQYGMNNYKQDKAALGHEILITNYDL